MNDTPTITTVTLEACCTACRRPIKACLQRPCETMAPAHATLERFQATLQAGMPLTIWAYFDRLKAFIESERQAARPAGADDPTRPLLG
jgi:Na+-translocating ferredoxin:NAD+ oxidoreductase RNF subunit RnfB